MNSTKYSSLRTNNKNNDDDDDDDDDVEFQRENIELVDLAARSREYQADPSLSGDDVTDGGSEYDDYDEDEDDNGDSEKVSLTAASRDSIRDQAKLLLETQHSRLSNGKDSRPVGGHSRLPAELLEEQLLFNVWNLWEEPCWLSLIITVVGVVPTLLLWMWGMYQFIGPRLWSVWVFVLHLQFRLALSSWYIASTVTVSFQNRRLLRFLCSTMTIFEIVLFAVVYPAIANVATDVFYRDVDGLIIVDWQGHVKYLKLLMAWGWIVVLLRVIVGMISLYIRCRKGCHCTTSSSPPSASPSATENQREWRPAIPTILAPKTLNDKSRIRLSKSFRYANILVLIMNLFCLLSAVSHFGPWPVRNLIRDNGDGDGGDGYSNACDPLDSTECALPFPSFHHMTPDPTTVTGWRVHLRGLPPLRGGLPNHPKFLNNLDGFSTMAPILFYVNGLKETHEANLDNPKTKLQGPENIVLSTTSQSITLLLDVEKRTLVHHSAEVDYLDPHHPVIMVHPAQPLSHATHYAVAVVNAINEYGNALLPPTPGMAHVWRSMLPQNAARRQRYDEVLLPALEAAAPWLAENDIFNDATNENVGDDDGKKNGGKAAAAAAAGDPTRKIQLLFDFVTISEESQLGPIRTVANLTLERIEQDDWDWSDHVRLLQSTVHHDGRGSCANGGNGGSDGQDIVARTIEIELDVPWFLKLLNSRYTTLDNEYLARFQHEQASLDSTRRTDAATTNTENSLLLLQDVKLGTVKCLITIPCSVEAATLGKKSGKHLRAIMEYGHGLFHHRGASQGRFLSKMANDNGWIVVGMDWRGMSAFDLPVVIKTLLSDLDLFEAIRDNLIQCYASKIAFQHFAKHHLLDWLRLEGSRIPTLGGVVPPPYVYYGSSQGGILGAGYTALSGTYHMIDRAILGVPGTPFAMIMTRSNDFQGYDQLLLLNHYNNRHVRIALTLVQMAWDSVEASGLLSPPVNQPYPRILMQCGLGDDTVPTSAAENLARAFGAKTLPSHPREVFGLEQSKPADAISSSSSSSSTTPWMGPHVTFTEVLFEREYNSLPEDNAFPPSNPIHFCLRLDEMLIEQVVEFTNTGRIINPCQLEINDDGSTNNTCIREFASRC